MSSKSQLKKAPRDSDSDVDVDESSDVESQVDDLDEVDKDLDEPEVADDKDDDDDDEDVISERSSLKRASVVLPKEPSDMTIVAPERRVTSEFMTMYEYAMVVGTRATHISEGAPLYVDATGISDAREIAIKEIELKRCPLSISRAVGGKIEIWEVNEMTRPA